MPVTNYRYTMDEACSVSRKAAADIEVWLRSRAGTVEVLNVEDVAEYREKDIDLLYRYHSKNGEERLVTIEIKGDRWHRSGNYFFETVSNSCKRTPGCFMYSQAEYLFYYFVETRELHIIPMIPARNWFVGNMLQFRETETTTPLPNGSFYNTTGRLVPRQRLQQEVSGIRVYNI